MKRAVRTACLAVVAAEKMLFTNSCIIDWPPARTFFQLHKRDHQRFHVAVDPARRWGEPVIAGTRTPTWVVSALAQNESMERAVQDYRLSAEQVAAAIAFERAIAA
jgi:uncharacterized protein (DUF433 family)